MIHDDLLPLRDSGFDAIFALALELYMDSELVDRDLKANTRTYEVKFPGGSVRRLTGKVARDIENQIIQWIHFDIKEEHLIRRSLPQALPLK